MADLIDSLPFQVLIFQFIPVYYISHLPNFSLILPISFLPCFTCMGRGHDCFSMLSLCFYALSPLPVFFLLQWIGDQRGDTEKEVTTSDLIDHVKVLSF